MKNTKLERLFLKSQNSNLKTHRGFTLIEILIYIGLVSVFLIICTSFAWTAINSKIKSQAILEVQQNARLAIERMVQEIHAAKDINIAQSDFDINLAFPENAGRKLSLVMEYAGIDPTEFDVSFNILQIKQETSGPYALTSSNVKVTDLTFTNLSTVNNKTRNIRIRLAIEHINPEDREPWEASVTLETTAELRDR